MAHAKIGDRFSADVAFVQFLYICAHLFEDREYAASCRVEADILDDQIAAWYHSGGNGEEGSRRRVAGDGDVARVKVGGAVDADHSFAVHLFDGQFRTEPAQHAFGVIARRNRFYHCGGTRRVEAGEENRALHLSAGDRQFVGNGHGRFHPFHHQGECAAGRSRKTGPHGRQRVDNTAHGSFRKAGVAGKSCGDSVACH